jgi:hypothetical protein
MLFYRGKNIAFIEKAFNFKPWGSTELSPEDVYCDEE